MLLPHGAIRRMRPRLAEVELPPIPPKGESLGQTTHVQYQARYWKLLPAALAMQLHDICWRMQRREGS